jgi:aspartyl-tRNA(Asn)/glutamyl-tRNA(Gln) amidotransferase subunit C
MDVAHVAKLANLTLAPEEIKKFAKQFTDTLKTVDSINELDTSKVEPTSQVTGLTNILREDKIDTKNMLSQQVALSQAQNTYDGYFLVPAIFNNAE